MFNIEDTHVVTYALKKFESLGLSRPDSAARKRR